MPNKGITARLAHCKQKQKEQAKKQGVKHARAPRSHQETWSRRRDAQDSKESDVDDDSDAAADVGVGYGIPENILDERIREGTKQYLITWVNLPESYNSWETASEFDDGAYAGAYVELVREWEEYKLTDPQYTGPTTTPPPTPSPAAAPTPTPTPAHKKPTTKPTNASKPRTSRKRARIEK